MHQVWNFKVRLELRNKREVGMGRVLSWLLVLVVTGFTASGIVLIFSGNALGFIGLVVFFVLMGIYLYAIWLSATDYPRYKSSWLKRIEPDLF